MALNTENKSTKENQKIAAKLHTQFGHPTCEKLLQFIKTAGIKDKEFHEIVEKHSKMCETCERYRRKNPRKNLSKKFNSAIAIDLKFYRQCIIFHMIDLATRYSVAVVIPDKKKETIV